MICHATRRMLSITALRCTEMFPVSDGSAGSVADFDGPITQNPCLSLFPSPKIVVPTFDPTRRIGTLVSEAVYQLFYERAYNKERFIRVANEGASVLGECIANEEWNRMSFLASNDLVEQAKIARWRCTNDQLNMLRFDPNDSILSFLHSSFISLRNFSRKYDHGIVCIYFTTVSFIRTSELVPYEATVSQLLDEFRDNVMVLNVTFARNLSPLGQWKATGINFFVPDALDSHN